jgi:hypothetical protein
VTGTAAIYVDPDSTGMTYRLGRGDKQEVTAMVAPLRDVRVVELTNWMAAPSAGAILADMGADVVKVEPPTGDPVRGVIRPPKVPDGMPKIDYSFQIDNRGKRSVAIAIDQPEGSELVRRLIANAHIFLCNLLPNRQQRYGLDSDTLLEVNPRLVHATLTGYGMNGPDASRPGYDVNAFFGRHHRHAHRARRYRPASSPSPRRPHRRACPRRRHPRWPASGGTDRRGPGRRRQPPGHSRMDDGHRPVGTAHRWS